MKTKYIAFVTALLLSLNALAQHNEEVTIEGTYRPQVNKVDKILLKPETPEQNFSMPSTNVEVLDIEHRFAISLDKLSAINYNTKNIQQGEVAENFLMAGIGTRLSPLFYYKHNSKITKTMNLGVGINHYSSWLGLIDDYASSGFMNNAFDVSLTGKQSEKLQYNGSIYYKNDLFRYYGIRKSEWAGTGAAWNDATPRQTYNTIGMRLGASSTTTRLREFSNEGSFNYHYMFSRFGTHEHLFDLGFRTSYANNWWGDKNKPQRAGLDLGFTGDIFRPSKTVANENTALFFIQPFFEMKDDFYRLHLGLKLDAKASVLNGDARVTVHPDLKGSLFVFNKKLEFYAGLNGGRHVNTFSELVGENPFLGDALQLKLTNVKLGFDGGLRTNVLNTIDLHFGVRYRHTLNDLFFAQYSVAPNEYMPVYDETQTVSVLANVRWLPLDRLTVDAGFAYNNYTMTVEKHAWYRPDLEGNLKVDYQFNDELSLNTSFLFLGGRWAKTVKNNQVVQEKLKNVFDLGLGADYRVNDQLTAFAKLENLFHQKYQLYYNYPVTGIEFFAGIKMNF